MNDLVILEEPLVLGPGATQRMGAERPVDSTAATVGKEGGAVKLPVSVSGSGNGSEVKASLTALQQMVQEILDPLVLPRRPVREWRRLYRAFFAFFAPDGSADQTERKAWAIATEVFNTNLVAVCNRTTQVVPMTFQDFVDGVDSF